MGLSLNNIYQRPYVRQENRNPIKKREDEEKSAATTQKEQESGQNSKSKGLQYVEQKAPTPTPAYEQKFAMPAANAYANVNVNSRPQIQQPQVAVQTVPQEKPATVIDNKINITKDMEKRARNIYEELSTFLSDKLDSYAPEIFPQGSFKLGTIIRPTTGKDEYDLDFVCLLNLSKENINQNELYNLLGDTLRQKYVEPKLEPKKRCWRINFDKFHVDILPAIPDFDSAINKSQPLLIPDKDKKLWQSTNPLGYAEWFNEKRLLGIDKKTFENSIHPIPVQNNDFVLQKIVKLMKYHRNYVFEKDIENRPISMIVTTLAAMNYDGTQDLSEALLRTCRGIKAMAPTILRNNFIPNPVDEK